MVHPSVLQLDQSFMVNLLSYFLFHPVLQDWYTKGHGMYYPVFGMVHIKDPLLLIGRSSQCSTDHGFLSCYLCVLLPYIQRHITIN